MQEIQGGDIQTDSCIQQSHDQLKKKTQQLQPLELIRSPMKSDYRLPAVGALACMFAFQSTPYPRAAENTTVISHLLLHLYMLVSKALLCASNHL